MQQLVILLVINFSSTCFGRLYAHHQEVTLRFTAYGFLSCCNPLHTVHTACQPTLNITTASQATYSTQCTQLATRLSNITSVTTGQKPIGSENEVWPPDDGRKDARNMLRNNWLPIKSLIVASSWSHLYLLIKYARSFEHKFHCFLLRVAFLLLTFHNY